MKTLLGINLFILALLAACGQPSPISRTQPGGSLETILSTIQPKQTDLTYINKVNSHLQNLVAAYLSGKDVEQAAHGYGIKIINKKEILVDIYINDSVSEASAQLTKMGMTVQATNETSKVVEGSLSIDLILPAAQLDIVKAILPVMATGTNQNTP